MGVRPIDLNLVLPTDQPGVVIVIAKHSARFKIVDLNALSEDLLAKKLEAYQNRFVQVVENSEHARHVAISPQAPFMLELLNALETLTLLGKEISQISVLGDAEYKDFSAAVIESVKAAQNEINLKKEATEKKSDKTPQQASFSARFRAFASKAALSASFSSLVLQVGKCFHECSKKILEIYLEAERRIAELDKEAAEEKFEKKKAEKKELRKDDLVRQDIKLDLLNSERLKTLAQKAQ